MSGDHKEKITNKAVTQTKLMTKLWNANRNAVNNGDLMNH